MDRVPAWPEVSLGPIYSFLPAGDTQQARNLTGRLSEALRAYLMAESDGRAVLLADFLNDANARLEPRPFTITCADLSHADPGQAAFAVKLSEAIFVISTTDAASLEDAREKAVWLRSAKREECCGLVLLPSLGGANARQAEHITGLPVCAVIREESQIDQLACWIAQD
jgi:hypothetical protein